jgi:monovalent cation:H+ antiporter-2, CPA2 family
MTDQPPSSCCAAGDQIIIAGYGVPGRAVAEWAENNGIHFCVIERNGAIVSRCTKYGTHIVEGDVTDRDVLKRAGVETARALFLVVPDEHAVVEAVKIAREMNPKLHIVARTHFISTGFEAKARGADEVVIAEQVVAAELARIAKNALKR